MAPHSSTLAWKIPWTEEPGGLQSMGSLRVGHDWATSLSLSLSCIGEGNGNPLQCSCLENPKDGGAWWAAVCGVAQSRTRLKWLSSSSSSSPWGVALPAHRWCLTNLEVQKPNPSHRVDPTPGLFCDQTKVCVQPRIHPCPAFLCLLLLSFLSF